MNWRGMEPPKMSSTNSKSEPRGSGSTLILQSPNWPWPPVCFLWRPCASVDALDRLAVGNARRLQVDVHAESPLQLGDGDLDVQLSLAGEEQLLGLRIAAVLDRRVLLLEAVHGRADLVLVAAGLRLDRVRQHRLGEHDGRKRHRAGLVAERVVGQRVLQLRHRAEVARLDLRHVGLRLPLEQRDVAEPLLAVARLVVDGRVGLEGAR